MDFIKSENKFKKIFSESELNYKNISLTLSFDSKNTASSVKEIAHIISSDSTITYYYRDSNTNELIALEDGFETYEQARAIIMQEKSNAQEIHN